MSSLIRGCVPVCPCGPNKPPSVLNYGNIFTASLSWAQSTVFNIMRFRGTDLSLWPWYTYSELKTSHRHLLFLYWLIMGFYPLTTLIHLNLLKKLFTCLHFSNKNNVDQTQLCFDKHTSDLSLQFTEYHIHSANHIGTGTFSQCLCLFTICLKCGLLLSSEILSLQTHINR